MASDSVEPRSDTPCCREQGCRRRKPFLIRQGGLSGRWFLVTDYKDLGNGTVESKTRHDITESLREAGLIT